MRRAAVVIATTLVVCLAMGVTGAQAVVVNVTGVGQVGVALVPGTCDDLTNTNPCSALQSIGVPTVTSPAPCLDPALAPDLGGPFLADNGLCYHGGPVLHRNETIAEVWSPRPHSDYASTYVEQFLRDVADGSGTMTSPYALTPQYTDSGGRAANASLYGGGYETGTSYPANGCTPTGTWHNYVLTNGLDDVKNDVCLTYSQLQDALRMMVVQEGLVGHIQKGYSPLLVLLTPPGVETCLDAAATLCSRNGHTQAQFCSYHSQLRVGGTDFAYVVQPWTVGFPRPAIPSVTTALTGGHVPAGTYQVEVTYVTADGEGSPSPPATITTTGDSSTVTVSVSPPSDVTGWYVYMTMPGGSKFTRQGALQQGADAVTIASAPVDSGVVAPSSVSCDEPDMPPLPNNPTPEQIADDAGARLVSPLSQGQIATIVDPGLNGWYALDGSEINDNGGQPTQWTSDNTSCQPLGNGLDKATVGASPQNPYYLQREFNNGWVIDNNPFAPGCWPDVLLDPEFVVPNPVDAGDVVKFDGSASDSTLRIPRAGYIWSFGDGQTAVGPSVIHRYARGGAYSVKLTVIDRGGYVLSRSQTIDVLGSPVHPPAPSLHVALQLLPQSLRSILSSGLAVQVSSNVAADGIVTLSVPSAAANQAHLSHGPGPSVVIARGTVSGIAVGTVELHLRLSRAVAQKLKHLTHLRVTVRLALTTAGGSHLAVVAAGSYGR